MMFFTFVRIFALFTFQDINPVFQKPTSRFENPSYGGDEQ